MYVCVCVCVCVCVVVMVVVIVRGMQGSSSSDSSSILVMMLRTPYSFTITTKRNIQPHTINLHHTLMEGTVLSITPKLTNPRTSFTAS